MLYDPSLYYAAKRYDDDLEMMRMDMVARTTMNPTLYGPGAPSAIGALLFWSEVERLDLGGKLRRLTNRLWSTIFQSDPDPMANHSPVARRFGIDLPLADDAYSAMMDEVQRYKWLEAERAGRDIWKERNPQDPENAAFQEWFRQHFGAWYITRYGRKTARI